MALVQYTDYSGDQPAYRWRDSDTGQTVNWVPYGQASDGGSGGWSSPVNPATASAAARAAQLNAAPLINLANAVGPSASAPWYSMGGKYYIPQIENGLTPQTGMENIGDYGFELGGGAFKFPVYSGGNMVRTSGGPNGSTYALELATQPGVRDWSRAPEGSFFGDVLSNFASGPGIPLGGFLGAGAFGSGGLGNFLGSFGQGAVSGAGGLSGGGMFNPLADFGGDYFSGISDFLGGSDAVIPSSYGANGWPTTGVYQNGPTMTNPFLPSTVTWNDGSQTVMNGLLSGGNAIKSLGSMFQGGSNAGLLGGLLGALAGGLGANQKPAGTVTSVQDIPDYLKPYQAMNLASGTQNFAAAGQGAAMLPGAQAQLQKTINGDYLDPNTNPAFQPYVKDLMGQAGSQFASLYGKTPDNLNNSGFQENYTRAISNAVLPLYNSAYQTERGNQMNAAMNAPGFASNYAGAALAPNLAFKNLYTGPQANTSPYFTNPMGGALSGGLAGYTLGNSIFGGK